MTKITNILALIFTLIALTGYSQEPNDQNASKLKVDRSGHVEYIKFDGTNKTGKWDSPISPDGFFSNILGIQGQDEFVQKNKTERKDGSYYLHYRQFCKGIEVEGGIYILHFSKNKLTKANGHYVNTTGIDTSPKLTPDEASKSYAEYLKIPNDVPVKFLHGLVISEIRKVSGKDTAYDVRLCYTIDLLGITADKAETGYIDAQTGEVLKTMKRSYDTSATGTFSTLYSATKNAGTQHYNNTYNLSDSSRTAIIHTWDINNTDYQNYSTNQVEFTDGNNTWTAAEHSTNNDQMALDIHWAMQGIFDYFVTDHGLHSFDGNNHPIDAFAHAVFENNDKDNARFAWFTNGDQAFFFGDGQTTFKPVAALDAVAHEFVHGITHNFTALVIDNDIQSAMNEGLSDIWGVVVETKVAPEKNHWKIGEEIIKISGQDCLRDIQNPESTTSNMKIADTYGDNVYTTGNFYAKSGVMSHWFYLLANGGSGTNHNSVSYKVYGLGLDEAAKVVFEGQTGHFANVTSYTGARTAMLDAANQIYGANSFQSLQVANAWYAVGVGTNPGQVTLSGADLVCYSGSTFTANNPPSGSTISWSVTPTLLEVYSGGSSATPVIRAKTTTTAGLGSITVNFTSNGYTTPGPIKYVNAGGPVISAISGPTSTPNNQWATYHAILESGLSAPTAYNWILNPLNGNSVYNYGSTCDIAFYNSGSYQLVVQAKNTCTGSGYGPYYVTGIYVYNSYRLSISPNPTTTEATIELVNTSTEKAVKQIEWDLEVYDAMQSLKAKTQKIKDNKQILSTSGWKDGVYIVRAIIGKDIITGKLIVKH